MKSDRSAAVTAAYTCFDTGVRQESLTDKSAAQTECAAWTVNAISHKLYSLYSLDAFSANTVFFANAVHPY